jgi:diguanylate cyclase
MGLRRIRTLGWRSGGAGTTVLALVRAATLRIGLLAVLVVGTVLTGAAAVLLHLSTLRNLELQARSVAYSVEAAVVFQDRGATELLLRDLLLHEPVSSAVVRLPGSTRPLFARYQQAALRGAWVRGLEALWPIQARAPVVAQGRLVGEVQLQADGSMVLRLVAWSAGGVLLAMAVAGVAVVRISRQFADRLVHPIQALAEHTRKVRLAGTYRWRAPRTGVQELDALSADFDALLDDLQAHHSSIQDAHDELRNAHERLASQVRVDPLTGAASRQHFEHNLALAIDDAARSNGHLALYFVDADGFKAINDQHGHEAGDRVLVTVVRRLNEVVGVHDLVGRLGGDEFVVLARGPRDVAGARRFADQLRAAVAQPLALPGPVVVTPGISVGMALYPDDARSSTELLRAADVDMYRHKHARRSRPDRPPTIST